MRQVLIILICLFSLQLSAQKGSYYLKKVVFQQKEAVVYHYQDGKDTYVATFKSDGKYFALETTKNKVHYFSLKRDKNGKPVYRLGKSEALKAFNKKAYTILPNGVKVFLAYLEADQQEIQPQFNGGGDTNVNNGIPNAVGPEIDQSFDGASDSCSQTADCSCGSKTVTVTCSCGGVISCYERTTTVCDTDYVGRDVNCRQVTGCAGRCD